MRKDRKTRQIQNTADFTEGPIAGPLIKFALPVLAALLLQSMYGAVDLLVVGRFAGTSDVSAVSTGAQVMMQPTSLITSLAMGLTIRLGQQIGQGEGKKSGRTIGTGIAVFAAVGAALTLFISVFAGTIAGWMRAPAEAFALCTAYVRICGLGMLVITAYNLIGSIFRGLGDSRTPLVTVAISTAVNIVGDLILVAGAGLGTAGAAIATVAAQGVSVAVSLLLLKKRGLPFELRRSMLRPDREITGRILGLGIPLALSDQLVGISFLIIMAIVNSLGVVASAGVGVAERICAFIMLVPAAFMQSMAAFVAQNYGAGKYDRTLRTLRCGILMSLAAGCLMSWLSWFHGAALSGIFARDPQVIAASAEYLRAYAIDCLLTRSFSVSSGSATGSA